MPVQIGIQVHTRPGGQMGRARRRGRGGGSSAGEGSSSGRTPPRTPPPSVCRYWREGSSAFWAAGAATCILAGAVFFKAGFLAGAFFTAVAAFLGAVAARWGVLHGGSASPTDPSESCRFSHAEGAGPPDAPGTPDAPPWNAPAAPAAPGAHPSAPGGDELSDAEIAEVLAAVARAEAERGSAASRKLGPRGVQAFLAELQRNPGIVTVIAMNDFPYHGKIEREYWLRVSRTLLQDPSLAGGDDFVILHVHYAGEWRDADSQAAFDRKRELITQINVRHTWDGYTGGKFHRPCRPSRRHKRPIRRLPLRRPLSTLETR